MCTPDQVPGEAYAGGGESGGDEGVGEDGEHCGSVE